MEGLILGREDVLQALLMSKDCQGHVDVGTPTDEVLDQILSTSEQDGFVLTTPEFSANGTDWSSI